jgi:hypothetical protein
MFTTFSSCNSLSRLWLLALNDSMTLNMVGKTKALHLLACTLNPPDYISLQKTDDPGRDHTLMAIVCYASDKDIDRYMGEG